MKVPIVANRDARDLALRRERAFERLAACSLASHSRWLSPTSCTISDRWMRRSTRVTTQAAEENTSAHSEKGLFVMSTGRERCLRVTTSKIRLFGVDAPESAQSCLAGDRRLPCGREAARALDGRIGSSRVVCEERDTDRYGRVVAVFRVGEADPARCRTTRHCVESELRIPSPAAIRGPAMAR